MKVIYHRCTVNISRIPMTETRDNMEYGSLSEKAYHLVKDMILACEKGQYLSMRDVASQIGMSYTPVREAFQRLKNEGLLDLEPNVGFFVPRLDISELVKIYEARECIEKFVLDKAFDNLRPADIKELKDAVEEQKKCLAAEDIRGYLKEDERFHMVFFKACNNPYLTELVRSIRAKYLVCSKKIRHGSDVAIEEHLSMIELIEKGDKEKAAALMQFHVTHAKQRMMEGYISYSG